MFVRAKIINGKKYAYLVKNVWKKGSVKQLNNKYLGRVFSFEKKSFVDFSIDFSSSLKDVMISFIKRELYSFGFKDHPRQNAVFFDDIIVNFSSQKIFRGNKSVVLFFNDRFFYSSSIKDLLFFYAPETEDDTKGEKLARLFSDSGILISNSEFVELYKKIYLQK